MKNWTKEQRAAAQAKAAETRARKKAEKDAKKQDREARKVAGRQGERRPSTSTGQLPAKLRGKCVDLVEKLVQGAEAGAVWGARHATAPVYQLDAEGQPALTNDGRPIIIGKVRAITDETIDLDKLEDWERRWLSEELTDELLRYPRLKAWLLKMVEFEERSSLPLCVATLALPRMVRHGMMPPEFKDMISAFHDTARKAHPVRGRPALVAPEPEPAAPFMDEATPQSATA